MGFHKKFFDDLTELLSIYSKDFPNVPVTVTLKVEGKAYHLYKLLTLSEELLTFAYFDDEKSARLREGRDEAVAWPALTVPYTVVESVEFNPGHAQKSWRTRRGFKPS